ncbi:MAG: type II secretion system protein E, partial [Desulfobacterales bacterium]
MNPFLSKPLASKTVCQALISARLISADQARDLIKKERQLRESIVKKTSGKPMTSADKAKAIAALSFVDVIVHLNIDRQDKPGKPIDEDLIYRALAAHWGLPYKKIDPLKLELKFVTGTISKSFALKHLLLPMEMAAGKLVVATPDPFNHEAIADVERAAKLKVTPIVSSRSDIIKLIREFFGFQHSISAAEDLFSKKGVDLGNLEQFVSISAMDELPSTDQHIVNAVNHLFTYSFDQKASDIHIEPKREVCLVRMRIDGALHTVYKLPKKLHNAVVSRIKT